MLEVLQDWEKVSKILESDGFFSFAITHSWCRKSSTMSQNRWHFMGPPQAGIHQQAEPKRCFRYHTLPRGLRDIISFLERPNLPDVNSARRLIGESPAVALCATIQSG